VYDLILKNIARFVTLSPDEEQYFVSLLKARALKKKQYLLQEGDISRYQYFVNKGCLRTYSIDEKGEEHIIQFALEDWWTGDMYSFLTQTPARYTIDALEDTELLCLEKNALEDLYFKIPKFERFFRQLLQNAFIAGQRRINDMISLSADDRYCNFVAQYPLMEKRLPKKQIASYLGIKPESLSRLRSNWIKKSKRA
jgi:CRP-like cAMP-binding protein